MKPWPLFSFAALALLGCLWGCTGIDDLPDGDNLQSQKKVDFKIKVSRDGVEIPQDPQTRGDLVDAGDLIATMDTRRPFGLVGIEKESRSLLIDNSPVYNSGAGYSKLLDSGLWDAPRTVQLSAYYPFVNSIAYNNDNQEYSIPYTVNELEAGPLVSKTVERAIRDLNMLSLEFQHITNDIGFKVCDVTPMEELQGLIHLRKLVATKVASAGVYVNDLVVNRGFWNYQGYYRDELVFEGDIPVGVGTNNEMLVGHRYYAIPDEIEMAKQCVEVVFDVDGFTHNGFDYPPLKDQVFKYMLYGLLPNNVMAPGKQYTFHIGLDLSSIYNQITFAPSVGDWETKIYENNDDF